MDVALSAVQWVVGKALAPVADGVLEAWEASKNLGLNIEALKMELLLVQATLETASKKEISGQAMEKLLQMLRDSAHRAEDLLDELDYFRIHDKLHETYDAADQHGKGGVHDHVLHARHTAKAVGKLTLLSSCWPAASPADPGQEDAREQTSCCAWPCVKHRARGNSSSAPDSNQANEEVRGCMPKLGKFFPRSSSPDVAVDDETPKLGFDRVDVSERMEQILEELQPVRREITTILQSCGPITVRAISQSRPITTSQSIEPKLYGRDHIVNSIIHDITKGKYCGNDLSVLPIVGPGGIGKTTLMQHIYTNQEVQNHFNVRIWVCVSLSFDLNKLLEEIKKYSPPIPEEKEGTTEQLIEQRLKSRRFLLVLDDIWGCSNRDDWKRLLLPLKTSQGNGNMIVVTTRFPAIAQMVKSKTSEPSIKLEGLELEEFQELFFSFVFDDEQCRRDHSFLLEIGYKIMDKLKGSPLAAKTVGRLLKTDLKLRHWRRVLESKEWQRQTDSDDIMPALKLSYDYLPFHQQQCFSHSALFPEDHKYNSTKLINFWIGLNILQPGDRDQTLEDVGLNNLNNLVSHGFFKEEETDGHLHYVMHDLLHDLALKVASHECLSLHHSDVGLVQVQPSIRHLSIIIEDEDGDNDDEKFKSEFRNLKAILKIGHLQTFMLFGKMDESFASIFGDLFSEANSLRVLHLPNMHCPLDSMLHNFSRLVHLRYLYLGTEVWREMHLPVTISILYHLKVLDIESCYNCLNLPKDMSNLAKLSHLYTPIDELHSGIPNVGKLELLQELKLFRVHKESEGFELKQLEHLTELRELGIYNLEEIHTKEEASKANLREKNYLERLTLDWGSEKANVDPDGEAIVLESLQPHRDLQKLTIRGHRGCSCPKWLGDELEVKDLQSFHLSGVSWEDFPSVGKMCDLREVTLERIAKMKEFVVEQSFCRLRRLTLIGLEIFEKWVPSQDSHHMFPIMQVMVIGDCPKLSVLPFSNQIICPPDQERNMDWFPKLQELQVHNCPEFLLEARIPWTETLHRVNMRGVKLLEEFYYSKSSNGVSLSINVKDDQHSIDQMLASHILTEVTYLTLEKGPCLELRHLLMLTSLKSLTFKNCQCHVFAPRSSSPVGPSGGQGDVKWDLPAVEHLWVEECGASGNELTELLTHLPRLSKLTIRNYEKITHLAVGVDQRQRTSSATSDSEAEEAAASEREDGGLLLLPAHLSDSLRELYISGCPELVLVDPPTLLPSGGGLQALRFLQMFSIWDSRKFLSACLVSSPSRFLFPSSLKSLDLSDAEGMGTLELLSNLTSLTRLDLRGCGEDLRCEGLGPLLGQLRELTVFSGPRFFAGWNPNARPGVLRHGGEERRRQIVSPLPCSSKLQELWTDDAVGLLAAPICSLLSSSLTKLRLLGTKDAHLKRFTNDGLHLLVSLQELEFNCFDDLQHLPAGLLKLTNLKRLEIYKCPALRALPEDGLPKSLQYLDVWTCGNEELKQQCRGLVGTIPKIDLGD